MYEMHIFLFLWSFFCFVMGSISITFAVSTKKSVKFPALSREVNRYHQRFTYPILTSL